MTMAMPEARTKMLASKALPLRRTPSWPHCPMILIKVTWIRVHDSTRLKRKRCKSHIQRVCSVSPVPTWSQQWRANRIKIPIYLGLKIVQAKRFKPVPVKIITRGLRSISRRRKWAIIFSPRMSHQQLPSICIRKGSRILRANTKAWKWTMTKWLTICSNMQTRI